MRTEVLDHGYVELIESWGSDERIVEAARMSTQKGFEGWGPATQCRYCGSATPRTVQDHGGCAASGFDCEMGPHGPPGDEKLLKYLYKNKHMTPFEMGGLVIEVKAPIFVFREWHRHRTQSYNEMSARYAPLPNENYVPSVERIMRQQKGNKQAGAISHADELNEGAAEAFRSMLREKYEDAERLYALALKGGVPKELARVVLPVGRYSKMRASANLRNWLAFLTLRDDAAAQWEIQQYARAVASMVERLFPRTYEIFRGDAK